ncbi:cell wall-binding repeat-containing protein [Rossellomorea yichunensis]|uniref:cell wall-binding repeat-containing protein n=1 Tax=Rossellomorea yichunensis TaxID=3077331 RepID=UPI0028DD9E0D|nr:cell wall-binding repeat-containing protein [Rossellomorea sp. YC4-1]MDT9026835.1 cell wall-binding repeat-containing protein [Rossellomorea sp. YC4-1]
MTFKKKVFSVMASAALVTSSFAGITAFNPDKAEAALQETKKFKVSNFSEVVALSMSEQAVQELVIVGNGKVDATSQLEKLGVKVKQNYKNYVYLADVPTRKVMEVLDLKSVRTVGKNAEIELGEVKDPELAVKDQNKVDEDAVVKPNQAETHAPTGVDDFHDKFDGSGTRIGIIDSGPDPGHESFTEGLEEGTRKYGDSKIVAVRDYTISNRQLAYGIEERYKKYLGDGVNYLSEGDVLFDKGHAEGDSITVGETTYNTAGIDASDDKLHYGKTAFETNPYPQGNANWTNQDLNADGTNGNSDNFSVLLAGDKVYIDTDMDNDFTDETAYANNETGTFDVNVEDEKLGANFRVNDMELNWFGAGLKKINLFTDFNGHGSHVSGISAANGPAKANAFGAVAGEGVAPGAELVGMRVFKAAGGAPTFSIQKAMVDAALPKSEGGFGVDVANLSLGSSPDLNDGLGSYGELMTVLSEDTDIVFVTSAGNAGPGADTVGSPGDVAPIISVGAHITADMWAKEYNSYPYGKNADGTPKEGQGLWYFSSVGPNEAGNQKPDIVGPGSAFAAHPVQNGPYVVMQGTSMSSPYVAGAVALLKSAAEKDRIPFNYEIAREALIETANHLDGYNRAQEGGGLIDVPAAYEYLRKNFITDIKDVDVTVYHGEKVSGGPGLYVRNKEIPETVEVLVENKTDEDKSLDVSPTGDWIKPSVSKVDLKAGESKTITVDYDASKLETGVNAETLVFDDASTPYVEARSAQTIVTGHEFNQENRFRFREEGEVQSSQTKGYTFDVKPGVSEVRFSLNAISENDDYKGRVRAIVFNPDGVEVSEFQGYAGYGAGGLGVEDHVFKSPKPGVWEVHVYGTSGPEAGKEVNKYQLEAVVQDVVAEPGEIDLGNVSSDTEMTKSVTFSNYLSEAREVKVVGAPFSTPKLSSEKVEVPGNNAFYYKDIKVKNNVSLEVQTSNPSHSTDDVDLYIFDSKGNQVAYSAGATSDEKVSLTSLPDDTYTIAIEGYATMDPTTTLDLSVNEFGVLSPGEKGKGKVEANASQNLKVGKSLTTDVKITTPSESVGSIGAVYLLDAKTDEVLSLLPIKVDGDIINEVSGLDRVGTAIEVSKKLHMDGFADDHEYKTVILSTGYNFPDSLSAGPLASAIDAPILPVGSDGKLSKEVLVEIERLGAENVYILGGEGVVSKDVFTQLNSISIDSSDIERLETDGMPNRYGTNLAIVSKLQELGFKGNGVFVATGKNFADALSAAAIAGANDMPIVLTDGKDLSAEAKAILEDEKVYVLGGKSAVPENVVAQAKKVAVDVKVLSGVNRYGTLAAILGEFANSTDKLYVASGKNFPDALSAAPLVTDNAGLLLLTDPNGLPKEVDAFLTKYLYQNKITSVTVLGGKGAVGEGAREDLQGKVSN